MNEKDIVLLGKWFDENYQKTLDKRYVVFDDIQPLIHRITPVFNVTEIGTSEEGRPIFSIDLGKGPIKILIWTQMHGNESTGTRAIFDLLMFFKRSGYFSGTAQNILNRCRMSIIPMLNPDGAQAYTRVNANGIDLNRDAVALEAKESRVLRGFLDKLKPDYNFNLHDQRSIFTAGLTKTPATLSFLAPSEEESRKVTEGRKETMRVIVAMNRVLQQLIPKHIGRYTDEFYPTATGDIFQKLGYPTVLIESGHYPSDYKRHTARKYTFIALLQGIFAISKGLNNYDYSAYFKIPENEKNYLDLIVREVSIDNKKTDIGIQFKEKLKNGSLYFEPGIEKTGDLNAYGSDIKLEGKLFSSKKSTEILKEIIKYTPYD